MVFGNMGETSAPPASPSPATPPPARRALYGEFLINAQGEDVVAGIRTPQSITRAAREEMGEKAPSMEEALPEVFAELPRRRRAARAPLPRHAGHRVHGRARAALHAADAQRQAHRQGGAEDRGRHGRRGPDQPGRGGDARRAGLARPALAPDHRSGRAARRDRDRACRLRPARRPARSCSPPTRPSGSVRPARR